MGLLFNCPCTNSTVSIPLPQAIYISDSEIERICLYEGGTHVSNPWHESYLEEGVMVPKKFKGCSLDDIEEYADEDEEDEETLDIPNDIWEE